MRDQRDVARRGRERRAIWREYRARWGEPPMFLTPLPAARHFQAFGLMRRALERGRPLTREECAPYRSDNYGVQPDGSLRFVW